MIEYTREEVYNETLKYFNNDVLATDVWIDKYSLKTINDNNQIVYFELTPNDMHHRLAREFFRIELDYKGDYLDKFIIFNLFKDFKYIIPQGSPMMGIGNDIQTVSLSNCFVIGNEEDSYGSIMKTDEEQIQLMKRRGGVGHDLSHIRPKGSPVKNSAISSTGIVPFMERYSNSTKEVAQDGRRGALLLSLSVHHPDVEDFIDSKLKDGKITNANISVKITDDFMNAVNNSTTYIQQYPINSDNPLIKKEVDANYIWNKIIHNAWKSAEPGVLFWDTIKSESIGDCYKEEGFAVVSTNPCSEIVLCPYDACRLLSINLYSYVEKPFTKKSYFNYDLFKQHVGYAQRLMDDLIDLEIEKIDKIISKINNDPESIETKTVELNTWIKIKDKTLKGRRTGLGITAEADMLAALGYRYGTREATEFSINIHKILSITAYKTSCILAKKRGSFPIYNYEKEKENPFIKRLIKEDPELDELLKKYGRRNISILTIAPTGSTSLMAQTSSGLEPVFYLSYKRRKKVNDKNTKISFVDNEGVAWSEYNVFHHKFKIWLKFNGYSVEEVEKLNETELNNIIKKSPYYKATTNEIDWLEKVYMQGKIQEYIDHSISITTNLPENVSEKIVSDVYKKGWENKCKGLTIYRENSRQGIIVKNEKQIEIKTENHAKRRPKSLDCEVVRFINNKEKWIGFLGLMVDDNNEKYPYELFTGIADNFNIPNYIDYGKIIKIKENNTKRYDFIYKDKDGYNVIMEGLNRAFNREFWNVGKLVSALLRHRIPLLFIINIINGLNLDIDDNKFGTWKSGVIRIIKKYINSNIIGESCPNCNDSNLVYESGCKICKSCGWSECS